MILSKPHTTEHVKGGLRDESGLQRQTCVGESAVVGRRHMSVEKGKSTKIGKELGNTDHLYLEFFAQQLWQECARCDSKKAQAINNPKFKDACKSPRDELPTTTNLRDGSHDVLRVPRHLRSIAAISAVESMGSWSLPPQMRS